MFRALLGEGLLLCGLLVEELLCDLLRMDKDGEPGTSGAIEVGEELSCALFGEELFGEE